MTELFPDNWSSALILVAHPDDPEYGMAAAVSEWTRHGKVVEYVLATSGEAGIDGMEPAQAGPLREEEQRRSARHVGVETVEFLGFPDGQLTNSEELRAAIAAELERRSPDLVITLYTGPEWDNGIPNQSDHIEFGQAVADAVAAAERKPTWFFESGPNHTHVVDVEAEDFTRAVAALAEHSEYLSVLDPDTPVVDQSRAQVEQMTLGAEGVMRVGFILKWSAEA